MTFIAAATRDAKVMVNWEETHQQLLSACIQFSVLSTFGKIWAPLAVS
jgi:hypothetical protein